ncbi:hypothetical protein RBQ61_07625 [Sedimentibacter sp. MB35-C1]|uniref:hypothetical protein n=1 Tax=Sedimentibacter sp. MB35-C1 TaxID=3070995 RepID=UPI0027E074EC|nr:hypothetical protein [Sedimentibacter sp. MB35-C1]WMJ78787.1 hypothetical protein RBQ61_07625 [Sedimentibacter sp. MB35-C1]
MLLTPEMVSSTSEEPVSANAELTALLMLALSKRIFTVPSVAEIVTLLLPLPVIVMI